jgi:Beta-propeller repeat
MKGTTIKKALRVIGAIAMCGTAQGSRASEDLHGAREASVDAPSSLANVHTCATTRAGAPGASRRMRLPPHFEINRGQSPPEVRFAARGPGYGLFLTDTGAVLKSSAPGVDTAQPIVVRMTFPGANSAPTVSGRERLAGTANYFHGGNPKAWRTNIPMYAKVEYRDLYPGVDLVFYGNGNGSGGGNEQWLEYDFIVAPGAAPRQIVLSFEGVDHMAVTPAGDLVLRTPGGELRQQKPAIYQLVGGARQPVTGGYALRDSHQVGFELGPYDATKPLVIDPVLAFSSYLGGTRSDRGQGIAVDASGSAYLTGTTMSADFPITAGGRIANDLDEVFVAKLNAEGTALVFATYLGGAGADTGEDIAIDAAGTAYLTGTTTSADFPSVNAVQPAIGGFGDAFVARLSAAGDSLIYATYLGGNGGDRGTSIAVDRNGNAFVTGSTASTDFPTVNAFQPQNGGIDILLDAFVTKVSPSGSTLVYSTYLGGGEPDSATGIAVNGQGQAYVTGVTGSGDFPTFRPFQPRALRGVSEGFVTKLSENGSSLVWSSNLGGDRIDVALDIAVDAADRAAVVGFTQSTDFPTVRPLQPALNGPFDAFVTIVDAQGTALAFSTYLGGSSRDDATAVAIDAAGMISVAGQTFSSDFPLMNPVQATFGGGRDAFITKIDTRQPRVLSSTFLGGENDEELGGLAVDPAGSAYVIGSTLSDGFPVVNALQPGRAGDVDAFFAKIADFTVCLQDDQSGSTLQFNESSGGYQFTACGGGGASLLGTGRIRRAGALRLLIGGGVFAMYDVRANSGFATLVIPGAGVSVINDSNTTNNTCTCP